MTYAWIAWWAPPGGLRRPSFSPAELRRIGGFAIGITGITILSFVLIQTDRIVLSKLLALDEFGVYAFAASVVYVLLRLVQPIVTAVYPRYSQLVAAGDVGTLIAFYHWTNQVMAAVVLPAGAVATVFATDILRVWTANPGLSAASGPIMALLVAGMALNGLMNLPYALQLAYGWTTLALWINVVSVCFVVPAVWIIGREFGGVGAAAVWLALNLGYVAVGIPLMHRRLLNGEMSHWYLSDILPPLAASVFVAALWRAGVRETPGGLSGAALLLLVTATTVAASLAVSRYPRIMVRDWWTQWRSLHARG